jgi:SNF2 family DNA or RNA helicase
MGVAPIDPPLWAHQKAMVDKALEQMRRGYGFAYLAEMGSGKSRALIETLRHIGDEWKRLPRTLIFCPPIVIANWKRELGMYSKIPPAQITPLVGPGSRRVDTFAENAFKNGLRQPHVFITNYEALSMGDLFESFVEWQPEVVIFDESHRLKDPKSKRSKLAEQLVNGRMKLVDNKLVGPRPLVYLLSGSPILNSMLDIFHPYKILDAGATFGTNYFGFRGRYFRDKNAGMNRNNYFPDWVPLAGAGDELSRLMAPSSMRVLKKDCLDLPPLVKKVIAVPMAPEQKRAYDQMLQDFVAFFESNGQAHTASATLAITKGLRLMQLASGYVKTVQEEEVNVCAGWNPKQDALRDLLEEIVVEGKNKVIIWAVWKQNYEQIRAVLNTLGIKWVEVHGDVSAAEKDRAVDEFNRGSASVLLGHPGSGGIGINLVSASYAIFYSRNFSLEQDIQAEARNYRGGSHIHDKVTRIDLVSAGSIEEKILERLACKQNIGENVLREITMQLGDRR